MLMSKKEQKACYYPDNCKRRLQTLKSVQNRAGHWTTMVALKYAASLGKESTVWGVCVCPLPPFQTGQPEKVHKFAEKGVVQSDSHSSPLSPLSNRRGKGENGFTIVGIELHSMSLSISFLFNVLLFPPPKKETKKAAKVKGRRRKGRSNILRLSFFSLSLSFLGDGGRWFDSGRRRRRRLRGEGGGTTHANSSQIPSPPCFTLLPLRPIHQYSCDTKDKEEKWDGNGNFPSSSVIGIEWNRRVIIGASRKVLFVWRGRLLSDFAA